MLMMEKQKASASYSLQGEIHQTIKVSVNETHYG